jgi:hypothetical protein
MNNEKLQCFTCKRLRKLEYFQDNKREYQLPHYKGKVASCKQCTRARMLRELRAVRYDFETRKFVIHYFKNKNQALKFWYKENNYATL